MRFKIDKKAVAIDIDKNGTLSIMSEDGNQILRTLERVKIETISKDVMALSGFELRNSGRFSLQELYLFEYSVEKVV